MSRPDRVRTAALAVALAGTLAVIACARTLPDQDLRILSTPPVAKLSSDVLWQDYQRDRAAADARFWGRAIEVSGTVSTHDATPDPHPYLLFVHADPWGVRANLLEDQAAAIVQSSPPGTRVTLRCFCAGLDGHVILKSCVRP